MNLVEENELLREQNRQLRALLKPGTALRFHRINVRGRKADLLTMLLHHETVSREMVLQHMYSDQADMPDPKIVDVMICHLRKKLKTFGAGIGVTYNVGWSVSPEHKRLIAELCR